VYAHVDEFVTVKRRRFFFGGVGEGSCHLPPIISTSGPTRETYHEHV